MIDHVSLPVADIDRAAAFYDAVLASLGLERRKERPGAVGYGPTSRAAPVFWLLSWRDDDSASPGTGLHVSFEAPTRQSVDRFHQTALERGGRDAGKPGLRPQYTMPTSCGRPNLPLASPNLEVAAGASDSGNV